MMLRIRRYGARDVMHHLVLWTNAYKEASIMFRRMFPFICISMIAMMFMGLSGLALAENVELIWLHSGGNRIELFESMAREFERLNPGVTVKSSYPSYSDNIKVAIAGGAPPDVMWLGNGLWEFIDVLMPLDNIVAKSPLMREIPAAILQSHKWDGKLIGMPFGVNTHAFYYNKDLFAEAGVTMPKDWTWDDAINMSKKLTRDTNSDGTPEVWGIQLSELSHSSYYACDSYTADFKKVLINHPGNIAAIQMYADLILGKYGVHVPSGQGDSKTNLIAGRLAMAPRGVFEISDYVNNANFDWDVTLFPKLKVEGKEYRSSWYSTESWGIYKFTDKPDLAIRFLEFLMSKENMVKISDIGGVVPSQASVAQASFLKIKKPANIRAFTDALNWWKKNTANPSGSSITDGGYWSQIFSGEQPAANAIPELAKMMQQTLDEFWANRSK